MNHASRTTVDMGYFNQMFRARIIVTANPSGWEGGQSISAMELLTMYASMKRSDHTLSDSLDMICT